MIENIISLTIAGSAVGGAMVTLGTLAVRTFGVGRRAARRQQIREIWAASYQMPPRAFMTSHRRSLQSTSWSGMRAA